MLDDLEDDRRNVGLIVRHDPLLAKPRDLLLRVAGLGQHVVGVGPEPRRRRVVGLGNAREVEHAAGEHHQDRSGDLMPTVLPRWRKASDSTMSAGSLTGPTGTS